MVSFNNPFGERKTKSGTFLLGGMECLKNLIQLILFNSASVIPDGDLDAGSVAAGGG